MAVATADVEKLAEEYEAEKPGRRLDPLHEKIVLVTCALLSLYAIYWVFNPVPAQRYRTSFLLVALAMTFLTFRGWGKAEDVDGEKPVERPGFTDWLLALGSVVALGYTLVTFEEFVRLVIPELRRRGLFRKEYSGATLREHLGLARPAVGAWRAPALR